MCKQIPGKVSGNGIAGGTRTRCSVFSFYGDAVGVLVDDSGSIVTSNSDKATVLVHTMLL